MKKVIMFLLLSSTILPISPASLSNAHECYNAQQTLKHHHVNNICTQDKTDATTKTKSIANTISDSAITTKIKAALFIERNFKSTQIHVKTCNGVVHLTGTVPDIKQKKRAEQIVHNIGGVKTVVNLLKINNLL